MAKARDLVHGVLDCSKADHLGHARRTAVGAAWWSSHGGHLDRARSARIIDGHTRLGVAAGAQRRHAWPLLWRHGQGEVLLSPRRLTGEEAERIGLVSLCVDDDDLMPGRWTWRPSGGRQPGRHPLDEARPQQMVQDLRPHVRPVVALEFLGFAGPDAAEGRPRTARSEPPRSGAWPSKGPSRLWSAPVGVGEVVDQEARITMSEKRVRSLQLWRMRASVASVALMTVGCSEETKDKGGEVGRFLREEPRRTSARAPPTSSPVVPHHR